MKDIILIVCVYLVAVYIYIYKNIQYIYISSLQTAKYSKVNVNVLVVRRTRRMDCVCGRSQWASGISKRALVGAADSKHTKTADGLNRQLFA